MVALFSLTLRHDRDVVAARRAAARLALALGFDRGEQTRIATAVSEIARNAFRYATGGELHFEADIEARPQVFRIRVEDHGPGIPNLHDVLAGRFDSPTGMGIGLSGARRLMDRFSIESSPAGTRVLLEKALPAREPRLTRAAARAITARQRHHEGDTLADEVVRQNHELMAALDELQHRQAELTRLNRELEDTNRGVVALYAELDEKADHLRRADEMKSRFLSNITHEFRTPVNAILGLAGLLSDNRVRDGLEPEPELDFIRRAADQLWTLINDLLDLAKIEAGKVVVRPSEFEVEGLFGTLRGMLKPLLLTRPVALVFDDASALPPLRTDEAKVSQILRNLIANGLKFTERGQVRVSAGFDPHTGIITFRVADTGIGIARDVQDLIFEEFEQIEHPLQSLAAGTGLGLPLSRRLAEVLGGSLTVESQPGVGSAFTVTLPAAYGQPADDAAAAAGTEPPPPPADTAGPAAGGPVEPHLAPRVRVLVIDDDHLARYMVRQCLSPAIFEVSEATDGPEGLRRALDMLPDVIVLDLVMPQMTGQEVLAALRRDPSTRALPVVIATAGNLDDEDVQPLRASAAAVLSKRDLSRQTLPRIILAAAGRAI